MCAFRVVAAGVALAACGGGPSETSAGSNLSEAEFVWQTDAVCAEFAPRFEKLPDGVDGALPVGDGRLMHEMVVAVRRVVPPRRLVADWSAGLDLMDRAAAKINEAERAELSGHASGAQSEALWGLEPRAAKKFAHMREQMHVEFRVCSFE